MAVCNDKYIIFTPKTDAQNAYVKKTGFLKSISSYAAVMFAVYSKKYFYTVKKSSCFYFQLINEMNLTDSEAARY